MIKKRFSQYSSRGSGFIGIRIESRAVKEISGFDFSGLTESEPVLFLKGKILIQIQ